MSDRKWAEALARWAVPAVVAILVVGCSTPTARQVQAIDSTGDRVTFLYYEDVDTDRKIRGMVECRLHDGELRDCQRVEPEYR